MKRFLAVLTMTIVLFTSSIAFAAYEENIMEGADLSSVKRVAVAFPNYYKTEENEPALDELIREIYEAGKAVSTREVISYDSIASNIRRDTGIDIYQLDVNEAEKVFKDNIAKYADSYIVTTVANNSERPQIFYYIYNAADYNLLYAYSIQGRFIGKNTKDYRKASETFYKHFDNTTAKGLSKADKKQFEDKRKELKNTRRQLEDFTYRTDSPRVNKVKKK